VAALAVLLLTAAAAADDYPDRPIRVFTTSSAGGISDVFMRVLNDALHERLGQPLIIENKPAAPATSPLVPARTPRPTATPSASSMPIR
jgi:tripartite-type tricarboxylate transporter receptor subunit TctC